MKKKLYKEYIKANKNNMFKFCSVRKEYTEIYKDENIQKYNQE